MDGTAASRIAIIIVLVLFSAYFSATETAFTSVNKIRIKNMVSEGNKRAKLVLSLSKNFDKLLTTILIGNTLVNITMSAVGTLLFVDIYGDYGATVSTIVITIVVLAFGEVGPKSMAKEMPEKASMALAPTIRFFIFMLTPITELFGLLKKLVSRIFNVKDERTITEDELLIMVEEAQTEGGIGEEQSELIQNAIEFNELEAYDVLTPRVDVVALEVGSTKEEINKIFLETGFSRLPVYEDNLDKVIGVLNQKDFHNYLAHTERQVHEFVKPVVFVSGSIRIAALLKKMQKIKTHIAVVVDEYGGTEGIVTMEDIIEELVGEIYDEHDEFVNAEVSIEPMPDGSYRVQGIANLEKFLDIFNVESDLSVTTVNGWVCKEMNAIPKVGDHFETTIEEQHFMVTVTKADDRKALEVIVSVKDLAALEE